MGDRELKAMTAGLECLAPDNPVLDSREEIKKAGENRDKWFFLAAFDL